MIIEVLDIPLITHEDSQNTVQKNLYLFRLVLANYALKRGVVTPRMGESTPLQRRIVLERNGVEYFLTGA
ncbi:hypothetical protein CEXT_570811 [Caerostris extrusa]|uniref:Uncharacterized protein n=1 Tax=Caerostris extrusa TaxID=172846 RepID=A0AAV4XZ81_CAEEX|nr:hypothetical protein CEXT_570811 [Caerostris extrusa]